MGLGLRVEGLGLGFWGMLSDYTRNYYEEPTRLVLAVAYAPIAVVL